MAFLLKGGWKAMGSKKMSISVDIFRKPLDEIPAFERLTPPLKMILSSMAKRYRASGQIGSRGAASMAVTNAGNLKSVSCRHHCGLAGTTPSYRAIFFNNLDAHG
jgi:hypothetical protein